MPLQQLAYFQDVLAAVEAQLEEVLRTREEIAVSSSSDMLDQVQHSSACHLAAGNLDRKSTQLREVRAALRRVHLGTFGVCLECEEEISTKRLDAVPWAAFCIVCQEMADRSRMPDQNTIAA